ncbi:Crp/Fnr family transcriptional regulator [Flaviflagellibacter deserti]|jgi:CRP/FNR family transcriptional regulator, cyclic AMP receptor protein|uniref:Crp/Fnr family transcriptional regulator n=1 Tax=Flaviflagellibacter deserti TaxID=2267266 RepID=A0ABV9Z095_9HYPH
MSDLFHYLNILAWVAAALSVIAAFLRTMIPLRLVSVWSNVAKFSYATSIGSIPGMVEYSILLPLNLYRLLQMRRMIKSIKEAQAGDFQTQWLEPFADTRDLGSGEILFRKGDDGDRLYVLCSGRIRFVEINVEIGPGTLFGELAFFTRDGKRTQTAACMTDCRVLSITEDRLEQLYFQNPQFGWYLIKLIAQRLTENAQRAQELVEKRSRKATLLNEPERNLQ